jgi:hypothetical protein
MTSRSPPARSASSSSDRADLLRAIVRTDWCEPWQEHTELHAMALALLLSKPRTCPQSPPPGGTPTSDDRSASPLAGPSALVMLLGGVERPRPLVRFARLVHPRVRAFGRTFGPRRLRRQSEPAPVATQDGAVRAFLPSARGDHVQELAPLRVCGAVGWGPWPLGDRVGGQLHADHPRPYRPLKAVA